MEPIANLNGRQLPLAEARISVLDRGFLFGDAVYEVLRIYSGKPWLLQAHWERLRHSLDALRIRGVDLDRLRQRLLATIAAGPFQEAIAYVQVTRGVAPRAHAFPAEATPTELIYVQAYHDTHAEMRQTGAAVVTYPDIRWDRCDVKSTNLLGNVLAAQAAQEAGCVEALLYLPDGTLTEGSHTSFCWVKGGIIWATPQGSSILLGTTRSFVTQLARGDGLTVRDGTLRREDLGTVAELFLTGTTSEVMPVVQVDGRPIADGRPGPVTRRLQELYRRAVGEFVANPAEGAGGR